MSYCELCTTSNFTFLRGASHPEELIMRAADLGLPAIAITDHNSLAGVVRAYSALKELRRSMTEITIRSTARIDPSSREEIQGHTVTVQSDHLPKLIVGARLVLTDSDVDWVALPRNRAAYEALSRLLTLGKRRAEKGACVLHFRDVIDGAHGMILIAVPHSLERGAKAHVRDMARRYPGHVYVGAAPRYDGSDQDYFNACQTFSHATAAPMVAVGDVLMHHGSRRQLADILTCIREGCRIDDIGTRALPNAERRLKSADDMARLFRHHPAALRRTQEIADKCAFCLSELSYEYPDEITDGQDPQTRLERLTEDGLKRRYPDGVTDHVRALVIKELALVARLGFAAYFLTVHDIVTFARSQGVLCQGRGSAANSILCYALGITDVGPETITMVFERFMSEYRGEPPDIDVDFEHERREEVIQYIYAKYGRNRAGLAASVITYRRRSAFREVAKVFGLSRDVQAALAGEVWGREKTGLDDNALVAAGLDAQDRRLRLVLQLVADISRFPRHLSQHVGGFVITRGRLDHLCPISPAAMAGRTVIEWDKDDLDALGLLKVDVLALGMLSCIRRCFDLLRVHYNRTVTLASVPPEDAVTYDMLCRGQSVGVFQVESRAQMAMLPRLQPRCFHDLVVQVAIVRPGPIQGDMVHPYLRRRAGLEKVDYPSPALREVLERTLGVPLFQEQAMQIAIVGAGFSGSEADQLRRAMATFKKQGDIGHFREKMVTGMIERGYDEDFALRCFRQIEGFGTYGFPESHAASFALLVYVSAWLKCHYPDIFICALLNAQPMGFYAPSQLIAEARRSGIAIRPVDVNFSGWDHRLETDPDNKTGHHALRLGLRLVKGLPRGEGERIAASQVIGNHAVKGRQGLTFSSLDDVMRKADVSAKSLQAIADADGFSSLDMDRRQALWAARGLARHRLHDMPLFAHAGRQHERLAGDEPVITLPKTPLGEAVAEDYRSLGLSLKAHPLDLLAKPLGVAGWQLCSHVQQAPDGKRLRIAGLVTMRQRPGTASGTVFITLEDGQGTANVIIWPKLTETYREALLRAQILGLVGRVQRQQAVVHFIAESLFNLNGFLRHIDASTGTKGAVRMKSRDFH